MTRKKKLAGDAKRSGGAGATALAEIASAIEAWHKPAQAAVEVLIPQLIITLSRDQASLQAELPGANGSRRVVALGSGEDFHSACLRILQAQARRHVEIGLDGAPTERQVKHWEHEAPDPNCAFCKAEGRIGRGRARIYSVGAGDGSVRVRKVKGKGKATLRTRLSLTELGL